jgi:hypothetical protein
MSRATNHHSPWLGFLGLDASEITTGFIHAAPCVSKGSVPPFRVPLHERHHFVAGLCHKPGGLCLNSPAGESDMFIFALLPPHPNMVECRLELLLVLFFYIIPNRRDELFIRRRIVHCCRAILPFHSA